MSRATATKLLRLDPIWASRLRNYEFEDRLAKRFGHEWVISEWCPFNGVWCKWVEYETAEWIRADIERLRSTPGDEYKRMRANAAADYLESRLAERGVRQ